MYFKFLKQLIFKKKKKEKSEKIFIYKSSFDHIKCAVKKYLIDAEELQIAESIFF